LDAVGTPAAAVVLKRAARADAATVDFGPLPSLSRRRARVRSAVPDGEALVPRGEGPSELVQCPSMVSVAACCRDGAPWRNQGTVELPAPPPRLSILWIRTCPGRCWIRDRSARRNLCGEC